MKKIEELLLSALQNDASDLHIKAGSPPLLRIYGELVPLQHPPLTPDEARELTLSVMSPAQQETFGEAWEIDLGYSMEGVGRFRVNALIQRGYTGSVFRFIPLQIRTIDDLGLPEVCKYFAERPRGLVLVTGPAGCGKSTTQAAMLDYINERYPCHIMTVEDPVEFIHNDKQALVNQRELGTDTLSFNNALKYVLRQDPDVILIGEMRDLETIQLAITAAETGHLVFGTLHTTDAVQTVDRVIDVFPTHQQQQIRMQLSVNLLGVISQMLVKVASGKGRVACFETLVCTPAVRSSIRERKTHQIASIIQTGAKQGMTTLDQYLASLVRQGIVTPEEGRIKAKDPAEFDRMLTGEATTN